jgi:hypothetical protein
MNTAFVNKIVQIELLYLKSSYNLCAQLFVQEKCRINQLTIYYCDKSPEQNKKKILNFLRALKKQADISDLITPHECLFYLFHCFIPFTYAFIEEVMNIINPPSIIYMAIMLYYYQTNYNACKSLDCCGINGRYTILCDFYDTLKFTKSLRGIWIMSCITK